MAAKTDASTNIENRSPWIIQVRGQPHLNKRFSFPQHAKATSYCESLSAQGYKAKLTQLETGNPPIFSGS